MCVKLLQNVFCIPFAYCHARLVHHGARMFFLYFLGLKIDMFRPLNVCPTAANRSQHALLLLLPFTIVYLCPLGLVCLL